MPEQPVPLTAAQALRVIAAKALEIKRANGELPEHYPDLFGRGIELDSSYKLQQHRTQRGVVHRPESPLILQ